MPSRRPHTKTRHGCNTCKMRKVRCDEQKPICNNCTRGNRACSYPNQQLLSIPCNLANSPQDARDQIFPVRDMELLHHYTAFTYKLMTQDPEHLWLWQVYIPQMAFSYRFLLHGLLAITALDRRQQAEESQKETFMQLARYHQQHALTHYIPLLQNINEENCHALFAFSLILGASCLGLLHGDLVENPPNVISRFLDIFDALLGATAVAVEAQQWLHEGELSIIMSGIVPEIRDFWHLNDGARKALEGLISCVGNACEGSGPNQSKRDAYLDSIYALGTIMAPAPKNRQLSIVISWPVMAKAEYIALLKRRDPLALAILGHWGVALHLYGRLWMLEGLGKRLTLAVYYEADPKWRPCLEWAKERIEEPITQQVTPVDHIVSPP
ncbi:hypothetical protein M409DRAFT_62423 [Zasmidium cellare ATCC 36951]|uniref:Zn(2)-C6 fungal-type domain-containing protein n=1 Tax=Zasmidium cellare ATCC 36951 TaxID=1080233 RepID=A0A6A6CZZ0_ZASCE|nr:uncharacterized protein M409DRAFT_62423 [Zasmidium cellare ATCC 36951]KAF2172681.1 hypothetical protein M409DRAFT_62423 [Zasmidium cellare ATCC 36951]